MISYESHGKLAIYVEGNLIFIEAHGPWNKEFVNELHQELIAAVKQVNIANYAVHLTPIGDAITSPENALHHMHFIKNGNAKAVAVNLSKCTSSAISKNLFSNVYKQANIECEFFADSASAKIWLDNKLV